MILAALRLWAERNSATRHQGCLWGWQHPEHVSSDYNHWYFRSHGKSFCQLSEVWDHLLKGNSGTAIVLEGRSLIAMCCWFLLPCFVTQGNFSGSPSTCTPSLLPAQPSGAPWTCRASACSSGAGAHSSCGSLTTQRGVLITRKQIKSTPKLPFSSEDKLVMWQGSSLKFTLFTSNLRYTLGS